MEIDLTTLPVSVLRQIPLSIRSYQDVYELSDLPVTIQALIKGYVDSTPDITYNKVYDLTPDISEYSDFTTISDLGDLMLEYLKNYLLVLPEAYPFDPTFGCRLKYQLQTKDTSLRQTMISSEIDNIVEVLTAELGTQITIDSIQVIPVSVGAYTEYNCSIYVTINGNHKKINMEFR